MCNPGKVTPLLLLQAVEARDHPVFSRLSLSATWEFVPIGQRLFWFTNCVTDVGTV